MEEEKRRGRPPLEKPATKPGFKPASRLGYLKAPHGFTARWVRNDPDNVARKRAEGWIIMESKDNHGTPFEHLDVNDAQPIHKGIRYRDMIAMMLPDSIRESRQEYYRNETQQATKAILRQSDEDLRRTGVQTYIPKGQAGRIVID